MSDDLPPAPMGPNDDQHADDVSRLEAVIDLGKKVTGFLIGFALKAGRISGVIAIGSVLICGGALVTGLVATSGAVRLMWLLVGGGLAVVGIGASYRSWRALSAISKSGDLIRDNVVALVSALQDGGASKLLEAITDDEGAGNKVFRRARLTRKLRSEFSGSLGEFREVSAALTAVTTFPALAAFAVGAMVVSGFFGFVFLLVLVF